MKKLGILLSVCALMLFGCSSEKNAVKETINNYFSAFQTGNMEKVNLYYASNADDELGAIGLQESLNSLLESIDYGEEFDDAAYDFVNYAFSKLISSYTIDQVDVNENVASVKVTIHGIDARNISDFGNTSGFQTLTDEYVKENQDTLVEYYQEYGLEAMNKKVYSELSQILFGYMKDQVDLEPVIDYSLEIHLIKDNDAWKITKTDIDLI
ncbi:MAG: hypothetical protein ACI4UK_00265 [Floccifex sp.]